MIARESCICREFTIKSDRMPRIAPIPWDCKKKVHTLFLRIGEDLEAGNRLRTTNAYLQLCMGLIWKWDTRSWVRMKGARPDVRRSTVVALHFGRFTANQLRRTVSLFFGSSLSATFIN